MNSDYKKVFAKNLSNLLARNKKTQADLVADLRLNKSTVSTWVNGTKMPRMNKIEQLADYFGVEKSDLIEDKSDTDEQYYSDPSVSEYAQAVKDNPDLKLLFDASKDMSKSDIDFVLNTIEMLKKREGK
jgi:DNA-binding protein|nr:MAG TPA: Repressor protein CI [Caudoviricetes sp.]